MKKFIYIFCSLFLAIGFLNVKAIDDDFVYERGTLFSCASLHARDTIYNVITRERLEEEVKEAAHKGHLRNVNLDQALKSITTVQNNPHYCLLVAEFWKVGSDKSSLYYLYKAIPSSLLLYYSFFVSQLSSLTAMRLIALQCPMPSPAPSPIQLENSSEGSSVEQTVSAH